MGVSSMFSSLTLLNLELYNQKIAKVTSTEYLGLTVDNKLAFSNHTEKIRNKINSISYFVRRNIHLVVFLGGKLIKLLRRREGALGGEERIVRSKFTQKKQKN